MASPPPKKPLVSSQTNGSKLNTSRTDINVNGNSYSEGATADSDVSLLHSLNLLSISSPSPKPSRSPRPQISTNTSSYFKPTPTRSPSTPRPGSALRSPFTASRTPSRSATPTLLRKASMNSLNSANGVAPPRQSSSSNLLSPSAARSPRLREPSPEPLPTPESVATSHFKTELETYHNANPPRDLPAETVVILNDACYGHRFSRPRTSRVALKTIVERPERIKACVMGVSAAYVRLGGRHEDGAFPVHPNTNPADLPSIPFQIQKTTRRLSLTSQTVTNVHGTKWMEELKQMCESAEAKLARNGKELQRMAQDGSNGEEPKQLHEGDLYLCAESIDALEGSLGGVCDAVDAVFRPQGPKRAFVGIRPPGHHCSDSYPSGFCWVNNVHVGIMHGILSHGLTHAAIFDFDLHHGDGSQSIAWKHNARIAKLPKNAALWKKTSIGYFSLHDVNSFPCENGDQEKIKNASLCIDNAHGQNIWNVHLQPWKTEAEFWALYESRYSVLLEKMRSYLCAETERLRGKEMDSKGAIFLSAGFDASEWEGDGMRRYDAKVPTDFYARLTRDIVRIAAEEGTSVEGRIVSVLEGGYSDRALCSGIMSHVCGLVGDGSATWWSQAELELLEHVPEAAPEPRKPRNITPPTYSSPTHASVARSVNPSGVRMTGSGSTPTHGSPNPIARGPTPPPPDVAWTVATHALSRLLIPTGRQTNSCTHESLNPGASRRRQAPAPEERPNTRMSLRERKAKDPVTRVEDPITHAKDPITRAKDPVTRVEDPVTRVEGTITTRAKTPVTRAPKAPKAQRAQKRQPSAGDTLTTSPSKVFPSSAKAHIQNPPSDDMDSLANSMKKVKITLKVREQQHIIAGEQAKNNFATPPLENNEPLRLPEHENVDTTPPSSEDTTARPASSPQSSPQRLQEHTPPMKQQQAAPELPSGPTTLTPPGPTTITPPHQLLPSPQRTQLPASSGSPRKKATPTTRSRSSRTSPVQNGSPLSRTPPDMFVAYQPEGPTAATIPMQKPLQWQPTNVSSTPSTASAMRRADLPMFTATSSIPFAPLGRPINTNGGSVAGGHGVDEKKAGSN